MVSWDAVPKFNNRKYEDLISILNEGTCIFLGAGVSKLAGYPLWSELENKVVDYFRNNGNKSSSSYSYYSFYESLKRGNEIDTLTFLYNRSSALFIESVQKIFKDAAKSENNKIYYFLKKLLDNGQNFFVTTNIDKGLQQYLGLSDDNVSICPDFAYPPKPITYLHGRIDEPKTWIFTEDKYNEGYAGEKASCEKFLVPKLCT